MTTNNDNALPKISKAYILGFGKQPFKEPKPPKPKTPPAVKTSPVYLNVPRQRLLANFPQFPTSGAVLEWVASDGRKGKLSVPPKADIEIYRKKSLLNIMNTGKKMNPTPAEKPAPRTTPVKSPPHATPAPSELMGGLFAALGGMGGGNTPVNEASAAAATHNSKKGKPLADTGAPPADNPSGFTKEQDEELLRRKTEGETWAEIVAAMGKEKADLAKRFGQIKPPGWKPNPPNKGKQKGANKGAQAQKKDEKQTQEAGIANPWPVPDWNTANPHMNNVPGPGGNVNVWAQGNAQPGPPGIGWGQNQSAGNAWAMAGAVPGQQKQELPLVEQKEKSGKGDEPGNPAGNGPLVPVNSFNDVYPDDQFSVDDLARISRILKRDHEQVWFRLSCAFKDKTGRHIHPDVFRKKLLGTEFRKEPGGAR
jgi:hypothetical protein